MTEQVADQFHEETGSGDPAVVLIHGGMCDHRDWDRLAPMLARNCRVVRLDLRGHGRSDNRPAGSIKAWTGDVLDLIGLLRLHRPILVGHSMASRIVAEAAASAPDAIGGVILLDGSRSHGGHAAPLPAEPGAKASLDEIIELTIGPFADAEARAAVHRRMAAASPVTMSACVAAMREWDLERADQAFAAIPASVPVLAIQSTYHDAATPRSSFADPGASSPYLDFLRQAVPHLSITVLPAAGHFTMLERPELVADLIAAFAEQVRDTHQKGDV